MQLTLCMLGGLPKLQNAISKLIPKDTCMCNYYDLRELACK